MRKMSEFVHEEDYKLYLVCPVGLESQMTLVVSTSTTGAKESAESKYPSIRDAIGRGYPIRVISCTEAVLNMGYDLSLTKKGLYH